MGADDHVRALARGVLGDEVVLHRGVVLDHELHRDPGVLLEVLRHGLQRLLAVLVHPHGDGGGAGLGEVLARGRGGRALLGGADRGGGRRGGGAAAARGERKGGERRGEGQAERAAEEAAGRRRLHGVPFTRGGGPRHAPAVASPTWAPR
ncbi:Uncharacterised protein [Streptococcus pneumoniae]|nr:Uncharacterised protein [Streptococcus pneumoniae]